MRVSVSAALIDSVVREHVAPLMKGAGFKKSARNWHRDLSRVVQVVNLQGSSWNAQDSARFTLNLGVFFPAVAELQSGEPPRSRRVPADACTVCERIGFLTPAYDDQWWTLTGGADVPAIGAEVCEELESFGLPWLDRCANEREAIAYLRASNYAATSSIAGFALALSIGDKDLAADLYREWVEARRLPVEHVDSWAKAHGLTS